MKPFYRKYKHGLILLYFFIYLAWFFYLERCTNVNFITIHIPLDDYIPFNELFIIPYLLWFGYIAVTILYFFFTSKEDYYKCTAFLFIGMTICLIIYTFWPNAQDLRPEVFARDNFLVDMVKALYLTDTPTNVCPSIHVYNSIGVHIAIMKSPRLKEKKLLQISSLVLAILICLATVFLKQHSIFDGICAILLSTIMYFLIYKIDYSSLFTKKEQETTAH